MKKVLAIAASVILALSLTACARIGNFFGIPGLDPSQKIQLSETWSKTKNLKASQVVADLVKFGYCLPQASDFQTPAADNDYGKAWAADQVRSCQDFTTVDDAPGGCQMVFYVSVGEKNLFNPKRSLVYEDSMSVLLLYGTNWQLEASPARGAADPIETTVANCRDVTQKMIDDIGGMVNQYGDYK